MTTASAVTSLLVIFDTQPARNSPGIFVECSLSIAMFLTSREHLGIILKGNIFKKVFDEKVVFALKMYDLIITNVDLSANSSNHKVIFPEYSRNISRMSVSKSFQGYLRNILRLWKCFWGVIKFKKWLFGLSCEIFNICSRISIEAIFR